MCGTIPKVTKHWRGSARVVSPKTTAASRTPARMRSLLGMWGFQAKVVTEADGRRVGYVLSLSIHGVAEPRFEEGVAGL